MSGKLIALTGATGFIGRHLLRALSERGYRVRVLLRRPVEVPEGASGAVVGRSIFASPGIPAERVKALREAFTAMTKDPVFLAEIEQTKAEFDPMSGEDVQKVIEEAAKIPQAVREKAKAARGPE